MEKDILTKKGKNLEFLIALFFTLIGVSPWFYKKTKAELQGQLPSNIEIPSDMQQWDI